MLLKTWERILPYFALLIAITIWGGLPAVTKLTLTGISVSLFITIRFLFSSLFLSPLIFRVLKKSRQLSLIHWCIFVLIISVMFYSQTWAIHQVPAPLYIVLFSATPVLMALCLRYTMRWPAILGLIVVLIALMFFLYEDKTSGIWSYWAIFAVCISMCSWIAYTVVIKQFQLIYDDLEITAITCFLAAIISVSISLIQADFQFLSQVSYKSIINAAAVGMVLPLAFLGYSFALRKKPIISIFGQYLEPVIGIIIAALLIGGTISSKQSIAVACLLIGVSLMSKYSKSAENK
jgi:drug/metabolite transporter (DMT)-like permease